MPSYIIEGGKKLEGEIKVSGPKNINKKEIPEHLMHQMRSTVILAGALIGRFKEARFSYPGDYDI